MIQDQPYGLPWRCFNSMVLGKSPPLLKRSKLWDQFPDNLLYILFITSAKESLCARNPRDLLRNLLADPPGGEQSWEGFLFFSSAYFFFFLPYLRRWSNKWFRNNLSLENICHHLIPPDCGDQLSATRFECGSNGLKTRGYRHLGWDFFLPVFLLMIRFSRDGVGIHQTQSLQWVGRKNKILLAFNRFQINYSVKGERPLWPLLQADRQGGGEQGEENQRRRNFLFFHSMSFKDVLPPSWYQQQQDS